jgi:hypothetical protein
MASRVGRGIALPFHDCGIRRGEWSTARPTALYPRERPGTHFTGGWVGPRASLDSGKSHPTGIRSPDRPARSQSLDLLCGHVNIKYTTNFSSYAIIGYIHKNRKLQYILMHDAAIELKIF